MNSGSPASYTSGYLFPGSADVPSAARLHDLEQAAVEQVAFWFQNRDKLGLKTIWPKDGVYQQFLQSDLLLEVKSVLKHYLHWRP
jgi:hypothetical protein